MKRNSGRGGQVIAQSLAAQLEDAKDMKDVHNDSHHVEDVQDDKGSREDESGTTIKGQLKRVFEKLRLQIVEEFLEGSDGVADLKQQYHAILLQQEDRWTSIEGRPPYPLNIHENVSLIQSFIIRAIFL